MYVHFTPPRYAIGTKLRVLGIPIHHEGTYVGPEGENGEDVVHCDKPDGMTLSHFDEFAAGGLRVEVVYTPGSPEEGQDIAQRALESVALGIRYDVLGINGLNCEQAANLHQRGEAVSPSLRFFVGFGLLAGVLLMLGRKS